MILNHLRQKFSGNLYDLCLLVLFLRFTEISTVPLRGSLDWQPLVPYRRLLHKMETAPGLLRWNAFQALIPVDFLKHIERIRL